MKGFVVERKKMTITANGAKICISMRRDREVADNNTYSLIYLHIF